MICLAIGFGASACTEAREPWRSPAEPDEAPPPSVERVVAPTPAMLTAALIGDPAAMQAAAAAVAGCSASSTCPTAYGACTGWSAPSPCNTSCFESSLCTCPIVIEHPDVPPETCVPDLSIKRERTTSNSFRVCFNAAQQACTEWKQSVTFSCGC
jgi:hypothetical protein